MTDAHQPQDGAAPAATDPDAPPDPNRVPDFAELLLRYREGGLHTELSEALADMVRRVERGDGAGTLVLKLKVKTHKGVPGVAVIEDDVDKSKFPKPSREQAAGMMFFGEGGALLDDNPKQRQFTYSYGMGDA